MLMFFKVKHFALILSRLQVKIQRIEVLYNWYPLISLLIKLIVLNHFVALLWYLTGYFEIRYLNDENNWIYDSDL